jgi:hypothetical protein
VTAEVSAKKAKVEALANRDLRESCGPVSAGLLSTRKLAVAMLPERGTCAVLDKPAEELTEEHLASVIAPDERGLSVARQRTSPSLPARVHQMGCKQRKHIPTNPVNLPAPEDGSMNGTGYLRLREVHALWAATGEVLVPDYRCRHSLNRQQ